MDDPMKPKWATDLASRIIDASVKLGPTNAIVEALVNTALHARKVARNATLEEAALMIEGKRTWPTAGVSMKLTEGNGETFIDAALAASAIRALATPAIGEGE